LQVFNLFIPPVEKNDPALGAIILNNPIFDKTTQILLEYKFTLLLKMTAFGNNIGKPLGLFFQEWTRKCGHLSTSDNPRSVSIVTDHKILLRRMDLQL
jgi:hypothetical protein